MITECLESLHAIDVKLKELHTQLMAIANQRNAPVNVSQLTPRQRRQQTEVLEQEEVERKQREAAIKELVIEIKVQAILDFKCLLSAITPSALANHLPLSRLENLLKRAKLELNNSQLMEAAVTIEIIIDLVSPPVPIAPNFDNKVLRRLVEALDLHEAAVDHIDELHISRMLEIAESNLPSDASLDLFRRAGRARSYRSDRLNEMLQQALKEQGITE